MKDLYKVLGLLPQAEPEVIKASFKVLAQKYHPDKHPDKKALFTQIMTDLNEAHTVLSNAKRRKDYDLAWKKFTDKHTDNAAKTAASKEAAPAAEAAKPPPPPKAGKHATVIKHIAGNKIDEFQLMQIYKELFGAELKIQSGWTNHYAVKHNGKTTTYNFSELKKRIIDKLSENQGT
jgi:curved DNA-binding protein CbpA